MKKFIQHTLSISLCLVALNVTAQLRPTKTITVQKDVKNVDLSKISQKPTPQLDVAKAKEFFKTLKVGTANSKEGEIKLSIVDDNLKGAIETSSLKANPITSSKGICTKELIKVHSEARKFKVFGEEGNAAWIKPGTLMKAQNFINGSYIYEQSNARYPITLSSDLRGINPVFEVQHPEKNSEMNTGISHFFKGNAKPVPADMSLYFNEVHSLEELGFQLTGKFSAGFGAISGSTNLQYGTSKENNFYYVEFSQQMFFIEVDGMNPNKVFLDPSLPVNDYVYLSRVYYGRKGLIIFESKKTLDELNFDASLKLQLGVFNANAKTAYNTLSKNSDVEIKAFFYGGSSAKAANDIVATLEKGAPDMESYIKGEAFNPELALPIGYELRNLNNEQVGLESNFSQIVKTCYPKRDYKLKVTLTDIQNIDGRDGSSNPDDYGIQQSIVYFSKDREMKQSKTDYNKFPNTINKCTQVPNNINALICGDNNNQIAVRENTNVSERNTSQINNSLIFSLPYEYYADTNASFKIHTWVKEYTGGNDKVLTGHTKISVVNIKDVMDVLSGEKPMKLDADINKAIDVSESGKIIKFHNFGEDVKMANIQNIAGKMILDYPIVVGEIGAKAVVWVSFELVN